MESHWANSLAVGKSSAVNFWVLAGRLRMVMGWVVIGWGADAEEDDDEEVVGEGGCCCVLVAAPLRCFLPGGWLSVSGSTAELARFNVAAVAAVATDVAAVAAVATDAARAEAMLVVSRVKLALVAVRWRVAAS